MSLKQARERTKNPYLQYEDVAYKRDWMLIPCGKCLSCRMRLRQDWATRMALEAETNGGQVFFATLTYDNNSVPTLIRETGELTRGGAHVWTGDGEPEQVQTLLMPDMVKFNKKLRRRQEEAVKSYWGDNLRYYYAGEYGELTGRPHYHAIYYGLSIPDMQKQRGQNPYWTSESLSHLWGHGAVIIAEATPECYTYTAGYVTKKRYGNDTQSYSELGLAPPHAAQSRRPGLGYDYYQMHKEELYERDSIILPGGKEVPIPRYFDVLMEQDDPETLWRVKEHRQAAAIDALHVAAQKTALSYSKQNEIRESIQTKRWVTARAGRAGGLV